MGSWRGGGHGAWGALDCVLAALTSWLGALLSLLLLRGVLPSVQIRAGSIKTCGAKRGQQQLPLPPTVAEPSQAAGEAGQDVAAGHAAPPGYNPGVEKLRCSEFKRLQGRVYADYAGAAPYSERLLAEALQELSSSLHGNPHSEAGWAPENRSAAADAARLATLRWCNADPEHYCCIFTAGATAALKLVGESFPWGPASAFVHLRDNHTSVLGIRELAAQHGVACAAAAVEVAAAPAAGLQPDSSAAWSLAPCSEAAAAGLQAAAASAAGAAQQAGSRCSAVSGSLRDAEPQHLFALPLESNFSGSRYDQQLVAAVQSGRMRWTSTGGGEASSSSSSSSSSGSGGDDSGGGSGDGSALQPLPTGRWRVLLDAAKGAASCPPDLARWPADFVALSYYKAFGWPTGLGALLVRHDTLPSLRRRYYGGGTVEVALADEPFHRLRPGPAGWEDGTPSFLDLPAVAAGFRFIERLGGFPAVGAHASAVASSLAAQMAALRHWNGTPVCTLYGAHGAQLAQLRGQVKQQQQPQQQQQQPQQQQQQPPRPAPLPLGVAGQGPVVTFNLLRADGSFVGYREVERLASLCGIMLRTGCCCNPGACAAALGLSASDMRTNWEAGHVCWDGRDVINGRPTGAVRASFGYASSLADAQAIVALVQRFFVEQRPAENEQRPAAAEQRPSGAAWPGPTVPAEDAQPAGDRGAAAAASPQAAGTAAAARGAAGAEGDGSAAPAGQQVAGRVGALWVYPIKSCRGFSPPAWPLGPTGLLYDRCWALVGPSGSALRLKQHPALATITATVDLQRGLLVVTAAGAAEPLEVPLPECSSAELQACGCSTHDGPDRPHSGSSPEPFSVRMCSRTTWVRRSAAAAGGDAAAAAWFSRVLGTPCRLVQQAGQQGSHSQPAAGHTVQDGATAAAAAATAAAAAGLDSDGLSSSGSRSFANEAHLLVVSAASLADLASRAGSSEAPEAFAQRFRPNLVVEGASPYAEDRWGSISLVPAAAAARMAGGSSAVAACTAATSAPASSSGQTVQLSSAGPCARCDVVCIDPLTGRRSGPEPLLSLAGYRRSRGRIVFGQLMNVQPQPPLQSPQPPQQQLPRQHQRQQQQQQQSPRQHQRQQRQQGGDIAAKQLGGGTCACKQFGTKAGDAALPAWVAVGNTVLTAALHERA